MRPKLLRHCKIILMEDLTLLCPASFQSLTLVSNIDVSMHATQEAPTSSAFVHDHELEEIDDFTDQFGLIEPSNLVVMHSYAGECDSKLLENIKPRFIVMYDPDPTFVRCIEVYKASNPGKQVRVYFTVYDNSVEEQLYLSALRREKDAFTKLIRHKSVSDVGLAVAKISTQGSKDIVYSPVFIYLFVGLDDGAADWRY